MLKKRTITKKVISKVSVEKPEPVVIEEQSSNSDETKTTRLKKVCFFCQSKTTPSYTDTVTLRRYQTDRAKIVPKLKSGVCSKHQRAVARQIKYARHLALLPFTPLV